MAVWLDWPKDWVANLHQNTTATSLQSVEYLARKGLLPQNLACEREVVEACLEEEGELDIGELQQQFAREVEDDKVAASLALELEGVSLENEGQNIVNVLNHLGIEAIEIE